MKVLMFGWEFPPHITGGLGTACYGLSKALAEQETELLFVVPKVYGDENKSQMDLVGAGDIRFEQRKENLEYFWDKLTYLQIGANLIPYVDPEEFKKIVSEDRSGIHSIESSITQERFNFSGKYGKDLLEEVSRYALIAGVLAKENKFDLIHAHDWLTYPAGIMAKRVSGKPLVIHVHATEFDRSGQNVNQAVYDIEREGMEQADKIIAVSNYTKSIITSRYGIPEEKVITVHNAVEFGEDSLEASRGVKEKVVTFLGRITFQKGPEYFVEAAEKVLQKNRNVRFVMAGSGDMLNRMVKMVARKGIADRFHFTGFLKGDEVVRMFKLSDVYVMPSVSEPFGISPLEAMRSNVPVIISKQSGVSEILHHAFKIDFWDVDAMADAIYGLLNYKALAQTFSDLGKQEVTNLKWEASARKVKDVYASVI